MTTADGRRKHPSAISDGELYAELAEAQKALRVIKDALAAAKKTCGDLSDEALDRMLDSGTQSVNTHGVTLYIHRQLWVGAKDGNKARACVELERAGLEEFVGWSFNTNSLSAHFRELAKDTDWETPEDLLTGSLKDALTITDVYQVRSRLAG